MQDFDCPPKVPKKMKLENMARTKYGTSLELNSKPKTKNNSSEITNRRYQTEDQFMKVKVQNKSKETEINIKATNFKFNLPGITKQQKLKKIPLRVLQNKSEIQFRTSKQTLNQSVNSIESLPDISIPKPKSNISDM